MKKSDLENLTSGLQTGIGLTRSCELVGLDIQSVSNEMEKDVKLVNELKEAVIYAGKTLLLMSQSNMQSKQFDKWLSQNEYVKKFHTELVTWESYCKKSEVNPDKVIRTITIHGHDLIESATSIGMKKNELIEFIISDKVLSAYYAEQL